LLRLRLAGSKPPERRHGSLLDDPDRPSRKTKLPKSAASAPSEGDTSDAGNVPLLRAIERSLKEPAAKEPRDAGTPRTARPDPSETRDEPVDPNAPVGNIEPDGGYGSKLPEDDTLPEEVDPDPCKDKAAVEKMPGIIIGATLKKNLEVELGQCV